MVEVDLSLISGDSAVTIPSSISMDPDSSEEYFTPALSPENYSGELICLKVKDVLGITPVCGVHTFVYTPFATFRDLINDVSREFQISLGDFELVYQSKLDLYELTQMPPNETLSAANLLPTRDKEYSISINSKKRGRRGKGGRGVARKLAESFEACADDENQRLSNNPDDTIESATSIAELCTVRRDFVGLKNMNMTCYLNSLLQGLWFTPEFRNLIYVYIHREQDSKKSICVPLQKLFLRLQFSTRESIETDELTNTFGWNSRDTWHQHDIEELCNLLMENLSMEFKGTPLEGMIETLFFGLFNDYVKCLECQRRNMRDAAFLVLPLPIRQIGSPLDNPTLEEALKTFTTPELLDGSNQYNCSQCDKSCDAHKGFLFKKLPHILTIQLKRFEYNWNTSRRYKLNDKIIFPMVLDMNPYMDRTSEGISPSTHLKTELLTPRTEGSSSGIRASHSRSLISIEQRVEEAEKAADQELRGIHIGSSRDAIKDRLEEVYRSAGPEVYQLYGVLVHRGGLTGGHYFAYIRDFETFSWYRCDDSYVRKADVEDIEISFGGDEEDKEPTSAYMLMYRRYDPEMNVLPFLFEEMPNHIQGLWNSMVEEEKQAHEEEELEKNTIKLSVHYRVLGSWNVIDSEMNMPKSANTVQAAHLLHKHLFPDGPDVPIDRLRVSRYDRDLGIIENSFDGQDDQYITYTLRNPLPLTKNEGLILEIREQDERFFSYYPMDLVFVTHVVEYQNEEIQRVVEVHVKIGDTVADLKNTIAIKLHLSRESLVVILQSPGQTVNALENEWAFVGDLDLCKVNTLFVQTVDPEEIHNLVTFVDNYIHTILIELDIQIGPPKPPGGGEAIPVANTNSSREKSEVTEIIHTYTENCGSTLVENTRGDIKDVSDEKVDACTRQSLAEDEKSSVFIDSSAKSDLVPLESSRKFIMKMTDVRTSEKYINCVIRVDGRMPLSSFSANISHLYNVEEKNFIIYKIDKEEEVELLRLNETIMAIAPFDRLQIRLGHRLQKDEGRVLVYLLDLDYPSEKSTVIGEVALNPYMTVEIAKALILEQCRDSWMDGVNEAKIRLRRRNQLTPSKVFRDGGKLSDYFNYVTIHRASIYVQILSTLEPLLENCYPVLIRRWRPSDLLLDPPFEIIIYYDHSVVIERVILDKLRQVIDLPENDIEVAKPDVSYPSAINPITIQELTWFPLTCNAKKALYVYNDELVLFVRDKTEKIKDITAEQESQLRLENEKCHYGVNYGPSPPKKETGLKMNLACSPP